MPVYETLSHFNVSRYAVVDGRGFDNEGILMSDSQYHPLTTCMYGIMCYDEFQRTGDSTYYNQVLRQYNYFQNPVHLAYSDNNASCGLPYTFDYHEMKAPWISGMTQGTAVSYLLRYYSLTGDTTALELSKKVIHLMLKDEKDGGTISRTPEGKLWIEEYPLAPKSKGVLNGFINGFIGLHEYCILFPNDKAAVAMRDSCYDSMMQSFSYYDTPFWTRYSRFNVPIANSYLRYQLTELDHLYTYFHDERFRKQMKIWARLAVGKPDKDTPFLIRPNYQHAIKLAGNPLTDTMRVNCTDSFSIGLKIVQPAIFRKQSIEYNFMDEHYYFEISAKGITPSELQRIRIKCTNEQAEIQYRDTLIIVQSQHPVTRLTVEFPDRSLRRKSVLTMKTYSHKGSPVSQFAFFDCAKPEKVTQGKSYSFSYSGSNLTNAIVFYRCTPTGTSLTSEKFRFENSFPLNNGNFIAPVTGQFEFFISYDITHPMSWLTGLKLNSL